MLRVSSASNLDRYASAEPAVGDRVVQSSKPNMNSR